MESSILLISLLCLLPLVFLKLMYSKATRPNHINIPPPRPPGLPIVGNLFQLDDTNGLHIALWKLSIQYGPIISLKLGFKQAVVISSSKLAREALKDNDLIFSSRPLLIGPHTLSYSGQDVAFTEYGEFWREMRKLTTVHLFTMKRVIASNPVREDEIRRMLEKCSSRVALVSDESALVNLSAILLTLSCNTLCRIAFGKRYEQDGEESKRVHGLLNDAQISFAQIYFRDYFPFIIGWPIDYISGAMSKLSSSFKRADEFYQQLIDEHLNPSRPKPDGEDFLDLMIEIKKSSKTLTWDHVKAILMNMFVAGSDTSASILEWAMCYLAMNPNILKKATNEIRSLIGNKKSYVDLEDISNLPYLKAVVMETMRISPPGPLLIPKQTTESCRIGGYDIPAKTLVYINAWSIGRDPDVWENPTKFYPDRFLGTDIDVKGNHFELIPFGAGRRICPGMNMGLVTVELGLANLLNSFDWKLPDGVKSEDIDLSPKTGMTLLKKIPLVLEAKKPSISYGVRM